MVSQRMLNAFGHPRKRAVTRLPTEEKKGLGSLWLLWYPCLKIMCCPHKQNLQKATKGIGAWLKRSWSGYRALCCGVSVAFLVFILSLIFGAKFPEAIQASAIIVLISVTLEYAASTKRMVDEAEAARMERQKEKAEGEKAILSNIRYEAEENCRIWKYLADDRTEKDTKVPLISFSVSGKSKVNALAHLLGSTIEKLRRAYFAMECINAKIREYYGSFSAATSAMSEETRRRVFHLMKRLYEKTPKGQEPIDARFLARMIEELKEKEQKAINRAKSQEYASISSR